MGECFVDSRGRILVKKGSYIPSVRAKTGSKARFPQPQQMDEQDEAYKVRPKFFPGGRKGSKPKGSGGAGATNPWKPQAPSCPTHHLAPTKQGNCPTCGVKVPTPPTSTGPKHSIGVQYGSGPSTKHQSTPAKIKGPDSSSSPDSSVRNIYYRS